MAAVKIQHKSCLQSTLRKKIMNTLFAGLGRSVLGKTVPSVLGTALGLRPRAVLKTSGTVFPNTDHPGGKKHRCIEQSLTIFYKCYKENGPSYLADLFEPRITPYNLRNTGLNVTQNSYNSKFRHNSYSFVISRIWNKLPLSVKTAPNLPSFRSKLKTLIFTGCQCKSCL